MDALPLAGRTALVTGAAAGIGAAISRELAGFGVIVVLADLDTDAAGKLAAELPAARALEVDLDDRRRSNAARMRPSRRTYWSVMPG